MTEQTQGVLVDGKYINPVVKQIFSGKPAVANDVPEGKETETPGTPVGGKSVNPIVQKIKDAISGKK